MSEVGILTTPTYEVQIRISLTKTVLHPKKCLVDTSAAPSSIDEDYLKPHCKFCIKRLKSQKL